MCPFFAQRQDEHLPGGGTGKDWWVKFNHNSHTRWWQFNNWNNSTFAEEFLLSWWSANNIFGYLCKEGEEFRAVAVQVAMTRWTGWNDNLRQRLSGFKSSRTKEDPFHCGFFFGYFFRVKREEVANKFLNQLWCVRFSLKGMNVAHWMPLTNIETPFEMQKGVSMQKDSIFFLSISLTVFVILNHSSAA